MAAPLPVLINRSGGTAASLGDKLESTVREAFAPTGRDIDLHLLDGDKLAEAVRERRNLPVIVVGGGDGTLGGAANALVGTRAALGILPLGTRNHLARQLGIPLDLAEAAQVAATGERRRMDLGRAGTRVFVNNASLGIYTKLVVEREKTDLPKWLGTVPAAWRTLRTLHSRTYRLIVDGEERQVRTPLLFIGNNRYSFEPGHLGERDSLLDGDLSLCAVPPHGPLQLIWLALKVLLGLAHPERDFEEVVEAQSITVEGSGEIGIALDGELTRMPLPLQIVMLPSALGMVAPRVKAQATAFLSRTH